jgi:hypothetical protein
MQTQSQLARLVALLPTAVPLLGYPPHTASSHKVSERAAVRQLTSSFAVARTERNLLKIQKSAKIIPLLPSKISQNFAARLVVHWYNDSCMPLVVKFLILVIALARVQSLKVHIRATNMGPKILAATTRIASEEFDLAKTLLQSDAPKITEFDKKVYEACLRIPAGINSKTLFPQYCSDDVCPSVKCREGVDVQGYCESDRQREGFPRCGIIATTQSICAHGTSRYYYRAESWSHDEVC